jgi:hypothetical protein
MWENGRAEDWLINASHPFVNWVGFCVITFHPYLFTPDRRIFGFGAAAHRPFFHQTRRDEVGKIEKSYVDGVLWVAFVTTSKAPLAHHFLRNLL